jgi:DNA-binding response OmpR family regulator
VHRLLQEKHVVRRSQSAAASQGQAKDAERRFRVLVVDPQAQFKQLLEKCAGSKPPMQVSHARTLAEARKRLAEGSVDLAVIDQSLPDGCGMELANELSRSRRITQTILITEKPSLDAAIAAIRLGAADYLVKPLDLQQVDAGVKKALTKQKVNKMHAQRVRRLRRLCKKLDQAREEVTKQVDILCNDLVTAYQELAVQMQQVVQTSEYGALIRDELGLDRLLRRTLEHVVDKAGPTNAAVFLPSNLDEYSLGGYVNYDCASESADMLLQHLADVVAPRLAEIDGPVHVEDNETLLHWLGDDAAYLLDSHVLGLACRHDGETLAVLTLFRDGGEPFTAATVELITGMGPMLGDALARVIRIHHRHLPDPFVDEDEQDTKGLDSPF